MITQSPALEALDLPTLSARVRTHEGLRLQPYRCTSGKLTIGYGRNLEDRGITQDEAEQMLVNDLDHCLSDLHRYLPWAEDMPIPIQQVLVEMAFNLGISGVIKFTRMLKALSARDWITASKEGMDSKWATQVGERAHTLMDLVLREDALDRFLLVHTGDSDIPIGPRYVLSTMLTQMGDTSLKGFWKMLRAVGNREWMQAEAEMMDSAWARNNQALANYLTYYWKD